MSSPETLSDLEIRPLEGQAEYRACVELQELTWGAGFGEGVPPTILQLSQKLGGVASGAFDRSGSLVGFVFGLTGWVDGRSVHWSDMLAVHPDARGRGLGEALKRHQRERLLESGVTLAQWTYDPLEARNGRINLSRLGATAGEYVRDFYGQGVSVLHEGIGTDRLIVDWELDSERVGRRLGGVDPVPTFAGFEDVPRLNRPFLRSGLPDCEPLDGDREEPRLLVAVPAEVQAVKRADAALARHWRSVTREAFEGYLPRGYRAMEAFRDRHFGYYLLVR